MTIFTITFVPFKSIPIHEISFVFNLISFIILSVSTFDFATPFFIDHQNLFNVFLCVRCRNFSSSFESLCSFGTPSLYRIKAICEQCYDTKRASLCQEYPESETPRCCEVLVCIIPNIGCSFDRSTVFRSRLSSLLYMLRRPADRTDSLR